MALKDIKIVVERSYPCEAKEFVIGDMIADKDDFGQNDDIGVPDEPYTCCDNQFIPTKNIDPDVLLKYGINKYEYRDIQEMLTTKFNVGGCSWCS